MTPTNAHARVRFNGHYEEVPASAVPEDIRFDVPRVNQGQTVEVAYGVPRADLSPANWGDPFRRTTDRADGSVVFARYVPDPARPAVTWEYDFSQAEARLLQLTEVSS